MKGQRLLANVRAMSRTFSIEVAKDYFNFASAHFLIFANGKREPLHGHNYQVSVSMEGDLDQAGVVLDFIAFKPLVKRICDSLDHRTLIQTESPCHQSARAPQGGRSSLREAKNHFAQARRYLAAVGEHQHGTAGGAYRQPDPPRSAPQVSAHRYSVHGSRC